MAIQMEMHSDGSGTMVLTDDDADYAEYLEALVTKAGFSQSDHPVRDSLRIREWVVEQGPGIELAAVATDSDDNSVVAFTYPDRPAQSLQ